MKCEYLTKSPLHDAQSMLALSPSKFALSFLKFFAWLFSLQKPAPPIGFTQQSSPTSVNHERHFEHKITHLESTDVYDQKHKIHNSEKVPYPKLIDYESCDYDISTTVQKEPTMKFDSIIVKQAASSGDFSEGMETVIANRHTFVLDDHEPKAEVGNPLKSEMYVQVGVQSTGTILHEISPIQELPSRVFMKTMCMDVDHPIALSSLHEQAYPSIKVCCSEACKNLFIHSV